MSGRPRRVGDAAERYIRKAVALRKKISNTALARKYGVSTRTITDVIHDRPRRKRVPRGTSDLTHKLSALEK